MEAREISVKEQIPASRKLQRDDARGLLEKADRMVVAKGKRVAEFKGGSHVTEDALDAMLGATGNLRAPAIVTGGTLLVGFNQEVFENQFD